MFKSHLVSKYLYNIIDCILLYQYRTIDGDIILCYFKHLYIVLNLHAEFLKNRISMSIEQTDFYLRYTVRKINNTKYIIFYQNRNFSRNNLPTTTCNNNGRAFSLRP